MYKEGWGSTEVAGGCSGINRAYGGIKRGSVNQLLPNFRIQIRDTSTDEVFLSSRRASAQAVTSKWQLRTTSPMNTNSSVGQNCFLAKNGSWKGRLLINPKSSNG